MKYEKQTGLYYFDNFLTEDLRKLLIKYLSISRLAEILDCDYADFYNFIAGSFAWDEIPPSVGFWSCLSRCESYKEVVEYVDESGVNLKKLLRLKTEPKQTKKTKYLF